MSGTDGGPAFPHEDSQTDVANGQRGMSLRDYFAAKAMMAFIANDSIARIMRAENKAAMSEALPILCRGSYEVADAMLKERAK